MLASVGHTRDECTHSYEMPLLAHLLKDGKNVDGYTGARACCMTVMKLVSFLPWLHHGLSPQNKGAVHLRNRGHSLSPSYMNLDNKLQIETCVPSV